MYSTLSDILTVAKKACANELYVKASSAPTFSYTPYADNDPIKIFNRNALISTHYADGYRNYNAMGLIAGNTDLGGYCTIAYAAKRDTEYLCIVMGAEKIDGTIYSYKYANSLLEYGFNNYSFTQVLEKGAPICLKQLSLATPENGKDIAEVVCVAKDDLFALVPKDVDVDKDLKYSYYFHYDELTAPITAGTVVGGVDVVYDGEVIASTKLIAESSAEANAILSTLHNAKSFLTSRVFILCTVFSALGVTVYVYLTASRYSRKTVKNIKYRDFY